MVNAMVLASGIIMNLSKSGGAKMTKDAEMEWTLTIKHSKLHKKDGTKTIN